MLPPFLPTLNFPSIRIFSNELALHFRQQKYWSFNFHISLSNECSWLISFRIDWFDLLAVQATFESSPAPQFKSINCLVLSLLYGPTRLWSIQDYWSKLWFYQQMDLCQQSDVSAILWGNLKIIMLCEKSQKSEIYYVCFHVYASQKCKLIQSDKKK